MPPTSPPPSTAPTGTDPSAPAHRGGLARYTERQFASSPAGLAGFIALLLGVDLTPHYNYLLFHSLAELFSICIVITLCIIVLNCQASIRNQYVRFIGLTYVFVGGLDLLHTLSYKGMPIFTDYDYYAPQFWIAARYTEAISMLLGLGFLRTRRRVRPGPVMLLYALLTASLVASILYFKTFPVCFVPGKGLTAFKVVSEYLVSALLLAGIVALYRLRARFDERVFNCMKWSIVLMIGTELCFTLYVSDSMSDDFNEIGHLLKICAFFLIYRAVVVTGLRDPISLLFRDLKISEANLEEAQQLARIGRWEWRADADQWQWRGEVFRQCGLANAGSLPLADIAGLFHADDRKAMETALQTCRREGTNFAVLLR